jgi:hypothetical protein
VAWLFALVQAGYGLVKYARTEAPEMLHHCWAACLVGGLYAVFFVLLHFGIYPDEHGAEPSSRANGHQRFGLHVAGFVDTIRHGQSARSVAVAHSGR